MTSYSVLPPGAIEKEDGSWVYPATQRPDGSWRKERRIRKVTNRRGKEIPFVPREEQRKFEPSAVRRARLQREAAAVSTLPKEKYNVSKDVSIEKQDDNDEHYRRASLAPGVDIYDERKVMSDKECLDEKQTNEKSESTKMSDSDILRQHEQKIKSLKKKLRKIDDLKSKDIHSLNSDQKAKLYLEESLTSELDEMLSILKELSVV